MKKYYLVFVLLACALFAYSSNIGHFTKRVSADKISVESVSDYFSQWFTVAPETTFKIVGDKTDKMGIRHISYQQFYRGVEVEGCLVLVHARDNTVMGVNGVVMEERLSPKNTIARIAPKKAIRKVRNMDEGKSAYMLTPVFKGGDVVYRIAYKVFSPEESADVYVDAETGDILKKIPVRYEDGSVQGEVNTLYSGKQTMTSYLSEGSYYLMDVDRNIVTYWGSDAPEYLINYSPSDSYKQQIAEYIETLGLSDEQLQDEAYMEYVWRYLIMENLYVDAFDEALSIPSSSTSDFAGMERYKFTAFQINSVNTTSWKDGIEMYPDLFITVENASGEEVFNNMEDRVRKSPTPDDFVLFNVQVPVYTEGYKVKVWDHDAGGNDLIETFDVHFESGIKYYETNVSAYIGVIEYAAAALDAHWGMGMALDYFKEKFERNSFDNYGSTVYQLVDVPNHVIDGGCNAFATTSKGEFSYMVYGMGDGYSMRPVVELDVMAHEFAHQVTAFNQNGGLMYQNESGALNEGFSDIFGTCVENYVCGSTTWLIGHEIMGYYSNMRSMKDPANSRDGYDPQPKAYEGANWVPTVDEPSRDNDQGGVHTNSGVLNYWFYLISEGEGEYTNEFGNTYTVNGIGIEKAELIAYCVNQFYLTPYATYLDAANASLDVAEYFYGENSEEYKTIFDAWRVVGFASSDDKPTITIKAKMPADWGNTISAWVWPQGAEGQWVTLEKSGEWYSYTTTNNPLNIVFVNGNNTWSGNSNQTVDISVTENTCIQIGSNVGKRQYTVIDCDYTTAVEETADDSSHAARKILRDGQLFIYRNGRAFTVQGQEMR